MAWYKVRHRTPRGVVTVYAVGDAGQMAWARSAGEVFHRADVVEVVQDEALIARLDGSEHDLDGVDIVSISSEMHYVRGM